VQLAAWELRRQHPGLLPAGYSAATRGEVDAMVGGAADRLGDLGFFKLDQSGQLREFLRDLAERAALSTSELRYFEAFIHKMAGLPDWRRGGGTGST
jgi:tRNA C32,U32 (ribose-2'-O)-methylase TrmJ